MRIITFSSFTEHSNPLFEDLNVIKLYDIITLQLIVFVFKFHCKLLPLVFDTFFNPVRNIHWWHHDHSHFRTENL